ncbi:MAG: hypothetical protein HQL88_07760, partial [Magnetococcales bacterium]|nr:hypothetical protein [Magnetococcales bacterium]
MPEAFFSPSRPALAKVVSLCCARDSRVWQRSSPWIVRHIVAASYEVLVPDQEVEAFRAITPSPFVVVGESHYLQERGMAWVMARLPPGHGRPGWYLQQFLKIAAACSAAAEEVVLIWDADTIPLKPLSFVQADGRLIYYKSDEHHPPYFKTIRNLLGLEKKVDFSFIAQCFAIRSGWAQAFCDEVARRSGLHWMEGIIKSLDFEDFFCFSEYESLGTFLTHHHPAELHFSDSPWQRFGSSRVGPLESLSEERLQSLADRYDYITFEWWDQP